jgi:serine/threonine protein kinase
MQSKSSFAQLIENNHSWEILILGPGIHSNLANYSGMRGWKRELKVQGLEVLTRINGGQFCRGVYLCKLDTDANTALKLVDKRKESAVNLLENEHAVLTRIDHSNIVQLQGSMCILTKYIGLQLEFVRGHDLCSLIMTLQDEEYISVAALRHVCYCIFSAVEYLHSKEIYHNDLKPDNILVSARTIDEIDDTTPVKLCDFGLAKSQRFTLNKSRGGSVGWAAPELFGGTRSDCYLAELWSLGCIVFALATNLMPFNFVHKMIEGPPFSLNVMLERMAHETVRYNKARWGLLQHSEIRALQNTLLQFEPSMRTSIPKVLTQPFFIYKAVSKT